MKALQQLLPSKNNSLSLFMNLILGFMTIIVLLVTFHFITISMTSGQVRSEIIKYNMLNLNNTVESYEKHYELVKRTLLSFMIHNEVQSFKRESRYLTFPNIQQEIQQIVANPLLHIQDIILYNDSTSQILNKNRSTDPQRMFTVFMQNAAYTPSFWEEQFTEPFKEKFLPAVSFMDYSYPKQPSTTELIIPAVFKIRESDTFYIVALLDAQKMFQQFHVSINEGLIIRDGDRVLYPNSDGTNPDELPSLPQDGREYILADDHYYFYKTGADSGFTYIQQIPREDITAQITIKATLMFILTVATIASIIAAWLFIRKINNPLQQVIVSLKNMNTNQPVHSNIKEFHTISHQFTQLAREKQNYSYMNQLKEIRQSGDEELNFSNRPFVMLLFDLVFKDRSQEVKETENKWYLYVKEFIDISVARKHENSIVFQTEKNQILCLTFVDEQLELMEILQKVKAILDLDQAIGYATIAVSSEYQHSSELTKAYEEALDRVHHRPYSDETTIIKKSAPVMSYSGFSIEQEQQFDAHLREGNATLAMKTVRKVLDRFQHQKAYAVEVESFAKNVVDRCHRQLTIHNLERDEEQSFYAEWGKMKSCHTFAELESLLQDMIHQVCGRIVEQKEKMETDHIVDYISQYVEAHFAEEIYLDELADKLKMSSGYLSTYFKSKTGSNFIEYLNGYRIEKAKEWLKSTDWKVREIALKSGYQNINSFNRMFKKLTGITPGEYRKRSSLDE
ncbi:AraC family transcriptional regulator [Paenibacillus sp. J2TS4]|uniref:helix-turn-helix domain-containing protein n=1 Tax=Paenibacillus sp. J2TS4 TaxID=2807194 RepID=UPI001B0FDC14|nr:AraC family transcriptional regulator [Paenibacillus sp. J2TS4]GIP33991.1 hypothetical protein J2TS4_32010 [Paenibacillus sp. J2TS4]